MSRVSDSFSNSERPQEHVFLGHICLKITDHFHLCELESNHKQFKIFGRVDGYRISILLGRPYGMAQKFKTALGVIRFHCPLHARKLYHCQSMINRLDLEQRSQRNSIPPNWIIDSQTEQIAIPFACKIENKISQQEMDVFITATP